MPGFEDRPEYSEAVAGRHGKNSARTANRRLRMAYFGLTAIWGYIVGAVTILIALEAEGAIASRPGAGALVYLLPALAVAVLGGAVVAGAYQEARRRSR